MDDDQFDPGAAFIPPRECNEAEARAVATLAWMALQLARQTIAMWNVRSMRQRGKKPTQDEMICLITMLRLAEQDIELLGQRGPTDGHALDARIGDIAGALDQLQQTIEEMR